MILTARFLTNVVDVNTWDSTQYIEFAEGDAVRVYLVLVDASKDKATPYSAYLGGSGGRRYMPASGATLQVVVTNLDDAKAYSKVATQAFPTTDPSIWYFTISTNDDVKGTPSLQLALTENAVTSRCLVKAAIRVAPVSGV